MAHRFRVKATDAAAGAPAVANQGTAVAAIRPVIADLRDSLIRRVANEGIGLADVIPLWFGEGDDPTPDFVKRAAVRALEADKTMYAPNRGVPELVTALADYMTALHERPIGEDRVTVTASGMNAIMLVMQALIDPGDEVAVVGPVWPNCVETIHIMGGRARSIPLALGGNGWRLDLDRLVDTVGKGARAVFINSPGNPTGWVMSAEEQRQLLAACRRSGTWIVADEVYERLTYEQARAPSFLDVAAPEDRLIVVNSFSKSWSMTGWRLGWMTHPPSVGEHLAMLNEYNIAGPTTFVQHAGAVAVREGEEYVRGLVVKYRRRRDLVIERLGALDRVRLACPTGAFYAFFKLEGMEDSFAFACDILRETRVGLAPGIAFGAEGEGWLRLCFAAREELLTAALDRLAPFLD